MMALPGIINCSMLVFILIYICCILRNCLACMIDLSPKSLTDLWMLFKSMASLSELSVRYFRMSWLQSNQQCLHQKRNEIETGLLELQW